MMLLLGWVVLNCAHHIFRPCPLLHLLGPMPILSVFKEQAQKVPHIQAHQHSTRGEYLSKKSETVNMVQYGAF